MKQLTTSDLKRELKVAFQENNKFIFKQTDLSIKNALKENNKINNKVLFKRIDKIVHDRLSEASDAILHTIDLNHDEANQKLEQLSKDVAGIKQDIRFVRQDMKDIVTDMSDKPSRRQFEVLKSKFDNYPTV